MAYAYMGKVLFVDLGKGSFEERTIEESWYHDYIGGVGLAARILYGEIPAGADALGPDNVLGFMSGLLTGTGSFMTGRWMAVCKSPITNAWGDANCGGTLSPAIKQCGYDGIFFKGISPTPVYLYIDPKGPKLLDASAYWGKDAVEAEELLLASYTGKKTPAIATIGQAAENLSLISGISNDRGRYAGRSGVGAVMGSKRLKAVMLAGIKQIPCANPEEMHRLSAGYAKKVRLMNLGFMPGFAMPALGKVLGAKVVVPMDGIISAGILKKWGTIYNDTAGQVNGDSPVKNWSSSVAEFGPRHYQKFNPDRIIARETRKYHCYSCIIGCGGITDTEDLTGSKHSHKPEYETVCAFGGLALSDNLDAIFRCNEICNRGGLDTISAGGTVAFAIECYEAGILTKADTGGLELKWGGADAIVQLLGMMVRREGIGDVLADGSKRAAQRIGKGSERFAVHSGGQEPGMHDSRLDPMMGVSFAADPTPGRHTISASIYYNAAHLWDKISWAPSFTKPYMKSEEYEATEREALKSAAGAVAKQVIDGAGGCLFALTTGVQHWPIFEYLNAATGWDRSPDDYAEAGRRNQALRQVFGYKHGVSPRKDNLHPRMAGRPPLTTGPLAGATVPIEDMVTGYWKALGFDPETGLPSREYVAAMGIEMPKVG